jgi:hypothetical protein
MDGHDSCTLISLSLLYRFANVLYVRTLFLLLTRFVTHALTKSRFVTNDSIFSVLICIRSVSLLLKQPYTISQFLTLDNFWSQIEYARSS